MFMFTNMKYALDLCGGYCILTGEIHNVITKQKIITDHIIHGMIKIMHNKRQ